MDIEKAHVGRVIGKGGETIRDIQQRSRVRFFVDMCGDAGVCGGVVVRGC